MNIKDIPKMTNVKLDDFPSLREVFTSSADFFKYFQDALVLLREDEEKHRPEGRPFIAEILPDTMEMDGVRDLKHPRVIFPRFSNRVIVQLPKEEFPQEHNKRIELLLVYAPIMKSIEMSFIARFSVYIKIFDLETKAEKTGK